jgi:hypothetical protein
MKKGPFQYGVLAEGATFTNREKETLRLIQNFGNGINTMLISPRRWGKSSLVRHAVGKIQKENIRFCFIDLFNVRTEEEFYKILSREVIKACSGKWQQLLKNIGSFFKQLVPEFGVSPDPLSELTIRLNWEEVKKHPSEILNLAEKICKARKIRMVICVDEFQNISFYDDPIAFQKRLRAHWQLHQHVNYCLFGSRRHILMEFFSSPTMPFYKFGDLIALEKISEESWIPFIQQRFKATGKKINVTVAQEITEAMQNHSYFVQQLAQEAWDLTSTECTSEIVEEAINKLVQKFDFLFQRELDQLTTSQLNFLNALVEGEDKFTASDTVRKYKLGTPGNVKRIREALENKEILDTLSGKPQILDPLFELWLQKSYFKIPVKKMNKKREDIVRLLCDAINQRRLVRFYYESTSSGKKDWRIVEPYIVGIKDKGAGNTFLAALSISELSKRTQDRIIGHYLIERMDITKLEILDETFDQPKVERTRIVATPTIEIICRFTYDDEDLKRNKGKSSGKR